MWTRKSRLSFILFSLFVTFTVAAKDDDDETWTILFDGKTTKHWRGYKQTGFPSKGWIIEGEALRHVAGQGGGDLVTTERFDDFELRFDWKVAPGANSGVMYRVSEGPDSSYETGPEYQVLDDGKHADGKNPTTSAASLYALVACNSEKKLNPVGEWNKARIVVKGNHVEHWLNKEKVVECELHGPELTKLIHDSKFKAWSGFAKQPTGHICLQDHGDDVWFRKIKIRKLEVK